jgi:hypothetical protein
VTIKPFQPLPRFDTNNDQAALTLKGQKPLLLLLLFQSFPFIPP